MCQAIYIEGDSIEDTRMRWDGCVVLVSGKPFYINHVRRASSETVELDGTLYKDGMWVPLRKVYPVSEIDTTPPPQGYVSISPHTYFFTQRPKNRHYKLGLHPNRCDFMAPNFRELRKLETTPRNLMDSLASVFTRKYFTFKVGVAHIINMKWLSVALSPNIALGVSQKTKGVAVYRNNTLIGEVTGDSVVLSRRNKFFKEELTELGINVQVLGEHNE